MIMIAFLHTSPLHIPRFEKLMDSFAPEMASRHFVNETLLAVALGEGKTDHSGFLAQLAEIRKENPHIIICTCSTYGQECEGLEGVERIDRPIAEYLVSKYSRIGLAFTASSTAKISQELLLRIAHVKGKAIDVVPCDCSSSWKVFEQGDMERYERSIADKVLSIAPKVDAVFLAQASMEGAQAYLKSLDIEVVSSAAFGLRTILEEARTTRHRP